MTEKGNGQRIGYRRVSSILQNTARQLEGVTVNKMFEDKASGKDTNRPQLKAALEFCREGDTLICHSMDRLSRSLPDLLSLVKALNERGVAVQFVHENLTFTGDDSPMAHLLLSVMGACAAFERAMILERQREGIALAVQRGGVFRGRVNKLSPAKAQELRDRVASPGISKAQVAREFGISRETLYTYLKG